VRRVLLATGFIVPAVFVLLWSSSAHAQSVPGMWFEMGAGSASGGGISNNTGNSVSPAIAGDSAGNPIICWRDYSGGQAQVYVKRWNGDAWVPMGVNSASGGGISNSPRGSRDSAIATDPAGNPIICWRELADQNNEIYVKRWDGSAWVEMGPGSASGRGISADDSNSAFPAVATDSSGKAIVCWQSQWEGAIDIYVKRWNGSAWVEMGTGSASGAGIISDTVWESGFPAIGTDADGKPIICWNAVGFTAGEDVEIYVKRWNGSAWVEMGAGSGEGGGISNNSGESAYPVIATGPDGNPIICWEDDSDGLVNIYVKRWNGSAWVEMGVGSASGGGISDCSLGAYYPAIATDSYGDPIVCWSDDSDGYRNIHVKGWNGSEWVQMGLASAFGGGISEDSGDSEWPAIATGLDGKPIICWTNGLDGPREIHVKRFYAGIIQVNTDPDSGTWTLTGPGGYSYGGCGDKMIGVLHPGSYTVTWEPLPDYYLPPNSPETREVIAGGTTTFTGAYIPGLRLRVTGMTWSNRGRTATISYEANQPIQRGTFYHRLYQTESSYEATQATMAILDDLDDGYYLFIVTARDTLGRFAPEPCRVWFINKTWGEDFQVYLTSCTVLGNVVWFTYAATAPCSSYYVRFYDVEARYTKTFSTISCCRGLSDGIHYFVATGREKGTGSFPAEPPGPARQFFYVVTEGFGS